MYRVAVSGTFSGAHRLRKYRGSCERLHGHNWKVRVQIEGSALDKGGFLVDFRLIKKKLKDMLSGLDHSYLNTQKSFKKTEPTAENIARYIFENFEKKILKKNVRIHSVRVHESDSTWAEYVNGSDQWTVVSGQKKSMA